MMHDDRTLAPSGSSTDSTAVAVPLQNRFTKPAKILLILPFQRVTSRAQSVCKNLLVSAPTVHSELCTFLHSSSKPRTPRSQFGKINGSAMSDVNTQRALWPQNGTTTVLWFAPPWCSLTYLLNARPRARRVGPWAIAEHDVSKMPRGKMSVSPSKYITRRT